MSDDKKLTNVFLRAAQQDATPLRDKDNTDPKLKPEFATKPAPNLAPPGMVGIRSSTRQEQPEPPKPEAKLVIFDKPRRPDNLYIDGRVLTMPGYGFQAKVYDQPSKFGIEGGKISKLDVTKDGELVGRYDRGWDLKPRTAADKEAVRRIRNGLDDTQHAKFKGFEHKGGKDHGLEH